MCMTSFSQIEFSLHGDDNGIVFKNFKTSFPCFCPNAKLSKCCCHVNWSHVNAPYIPRTDVWGERGRETEAIQKPKSVYHQNDKIQKETCIHLLCHTKINQINFSSLDKILKQCSSANKWCLEFDWHHWNLAKHSENIYFVLFAIDQHNIWFYSTFRSFKSVKWSGFEINGNDNKWLSPCIADLLEFIVYVSDTGLKAFWLLRETVLPTLKTWSLCVILRCTVYSKRKTT